MTPVQWAVSQIGNGYIYGAKGQTCTLAFRQQQAKQYPQQSTMILTTGAKWDGKTVYDCAQFTRYAWKNAGVQLCSGATSQYNKTDWLQSGTIDKLPTDKVCSVFRDKNGVKQHTGLYCGDGYVIHAQGTKSGIIRQNLQEYPWTHYAIPKKDDKQEAVNVDVLYTAVVTAESGSTVNIRSEASKKSRVVTAVNIGKTVNVLQQCGEWVNVEYKGKAGYMMGKYLVYGTGETEKENLLYGQRLTELQKRVACLEKILAKG